MTNSNLPSSGPAPLCRDSNPLKGADVIAQSLRAIGVRTVFCYPGGANLEILDALSRADITLIRVEHEQGAVFAAQGYARASGRLGVCLATSGPGATNLVTGIADANSDSVPVLAITGNVATHWLGKNAFQEVDIVAVTTPITKLARQVHDVQDIAPAIRAAAETALNGRPGPVLLDFPKDVQQRVSGQSRVDISVGRAPNDAPRGRATLPISSAALSQIEGLLAQSTKPVIYAGGGVIASGSAAALVQLAETLGCPVALTLMGLGAMNANHPLCLGPLGMHGAYCANVAVNEADLVLALGVRFDDRVIGDPAGFAASATIIHIDIDQNEIGKNKPVQIGVCADLRDALAQLLSKARQLPTERWLEYLAGIAEQRPLHAPVKARASLTGTNAIALLSAHLPDEVIVTTGVGQHQMWAMQHFRPRGPRGFLSSSGFGTMGFGLPAAIGAKCAVPAALVVDIDGDGSLNMTINELSTCRRHGIGVKLFVINNQWLGMVRQWQDMIYAGNRVVSGLHDPLSEVRPGDDADVYPDFVSIASGYRVDAMRVRSAAELEAALPRFLEDPDKPFLLDVLVDREANVFPMIPAGKTYRDVIFESDVVQLHDT